MLVHRREVADQITEEVKNAARVFLAEASERPIGAARIEREDCLQVGRLLLGGMKLLGTEA